MAQGKAERNPRFVRELAQALELESALHSAYLEIIEREKAALTKFKAEEVSVLTEQRLQITERIRDAKDRRFAILDAVPEGRKEKLSVLVTRYLHPDDAAKLLPLVGKLKDAVAAAKQKSLEFNQIAGFSLGIVNGSLSILSSATQNVVRSYNPMGVMRESYNPASSRSAGVLKSA